MQSINSTGMETPRKNTTVLVVPKDKASLKKMFESLPDGSTTKALIQRRKNAATTKDVDEAITMALALTGVKGFTDLQWKFMRQELLKLGVTRDEILKRARSVALNPNREFGSIGLQYWSGSTTLTTDTVDFAVAYRLKKILAEVELRIKHPDAKEVGDSAIARLEFEYENEFREMLKKAYDEQAAKDKAEVKAIQKKIRTMNRDQRIKLFLRAVKAGIFSMAKGNQPDSIIIDYMDHTTIVQKLLPLFRKANQ